MSEQRYIKSNDANSGSTRMCDLASVNNTFEQEESNATLMSQMDCGNTEILRSEISMP